MRHEREQSRDEHLTSIRAPQYLLREGGDATSAATRGAYPRVTHIYVPWSSCHKVRSFSFVFVARRSPGRALSWAYRHGRAGWPSFPRERVGDLGAPRARQEQVL